MLIEKVTPDDIEIGLQASDWEDAIRKSSKILLNKGAIEQSYVEAMINVVKENGPYIVLGKHVALAHGRPECGVNKLALSFATLATPVEFGSEDFDPVKLIITLAATDSKSHIGLLSELADVLMEQDRMEVLFNAQSKEEFYKELTRKEQVDFT